MPPLQEVAAAQSANKPNHQLKRRQGVRRKEGESKSAGWKHELNARNIGHGFDAAPPEKVCLRIHKVDGRVVAIMLVAPIFCVNWIVCSLCGSVTNWNIVGKHTCGEDNGNMVESEGALCDLLTGSVGNFLTFGSEGGVEELSEVVGGGGTYIDIGKKKTAKKPNMVKELIN